MLWGRKRQQQQQPEPGDDDKPGNEFEGDVGNCGSFCDSTDGQGKKHSPAERQAEEREWKTAGAEAIAVAKRAGSVSGSLVEMFDKLRAPRVDWREALRRFVGASAKQDYSWTPPIVGTSPLASTCHRCAATAWARSSSRSTPRAA